MAVVLELSYNVHTRMKCTKLIHENKNKTATHKKSGIQACK